MNNGRTVLGMFALASMFVAIFFGLVAMSNAYQYEWRKRFAWAHLDLAEASSDITTQYSEVSKAIQILDTFPQNGNWDFWNKLSPKSNMVNAWLAFYEVQNYTRSTSTLNRTDAAYNVAVYNNQEKIQYVEEQYSGAFDNYITWGAGSYLGSVGIIFGVFWVFSWGITWFWAFSDESTLEAVMWIMMIVPLIIAAAFFLWVGLTPIYYIGPT